MGAAPTPLVFKPPHPVPTGCFPPGTMRVFLGGSIEMGKARLWQDEFVDAFRAAPVAWLNPRRDDWDPSWGEGNPELVRQIQWELDGQQGADLCVYYLQAGTMSPVTMLELGLFGPPGRGRSVVMCEPGFWRFTNVQVTCERYGIPFATGWDRFLELAGERIRSWPRGQRGAVAG